MMENNSIAHKKMFTGGRDYSVDILRSISCFMVVSGHVFGLFFDGIDGHSIFSPGTMEHYTALFFRSLTTSATDIFLMISGIFFLSPERNITPRKIWGKNILKMSAALVLWLILYGWFESIIMFGHPTRSEIIYQIFHQGNKHLWYIPMMIGVYITVPLMRVFTQNAKSFHYHYLFVVVLAASVLGLLIVFSRAYKYPGSEEIASVIAKTPYAYLSHLFFLPIIGYWLYSSRIKRSLRGLLYLLGAAGVLAMLFMQIAYFKQTGNMQCDVVLGKMTAGNIFKCVAIFLFVTTALEGVRLNKLATLIVKKVSAATLFIYLYHWMAIRFLLYKGWLMNGSWADHSIAVAFIYIAVIYICGFILSVVFLQTIPWLKMRNAVLDAVAPNRKIYVTKRR